MLTPINTAHLAALESELARVTAQRDALRDALRRIRNSGNKHGQNLTFHYQSLQDSIVEALQASQD